METKSCPDHIFTPLDQRFSVETPNEEWLQAMRGIDFWIAVRELEKFLIQGLCRSLAIRYGEKFNRNLDKIIDDSLAEIARSLDRFRDGRHFTTWAMKIAVHRAFHYLRDPVN